MGILKGLAIVGGAVSIYGGLTLHKQWKNYKVLVNKMIDEEWDTVFGKDHLPNLKEQTRKTIWIASKSEFDKLDTMLRFFKYTDVEKNLDIFNARFQRHCRRIAYDVFR